MLCLTKNAVKFMQKCSVQMKEVFEENK